MTSFQIVYAKTPDTIASPSAIEAIRCIFVEYLAFVEAFLGESLDFQDTETEFNDFPHTYDILLLATVEAQAVAACGIKPFKASICELKRLYCRDEARGLGIGEALVRESFKAAQTLGYSQMYLDTDPGLLHANRIYERLGFQDIEKYYNNPMDRSRYMAKAL